MSFYYKVFVTPFSFSWDSNKKKKNSLHQISVMKFILSSWFDIYIR